MTEERTDPNVDIASDYSATGEGRTVMVLITRARARRDEKQNDFEVEPSFTENGYNPGVEANTPEFRALREFTEEFGGYMASHPTQGTAPLLPPQECSPSTIPTKNTD